MRKKRRVRFIMAIIIAMTALVLFRLSFSLKVKFVCYDTREKVLFFYGDDAPFLENVIAPFWSEDSILAVFDGGEEAFIGKYVMKEGEWEILLPVSRVREKLGRDIELSLFSNFRIADNGNLTFIYDDVIYSYNLIAKEMDALKVCDNIQRFEWADDNTLLILDEMCDLYVGWLKKYNIQTGEEAVIDKSVLDFVYLTEEQQAIYAKKYFLGSWCEYELNCADANELEILKNKRYFNTSIGQIIVDSKNNIFVVEDWLSSDNEQEVKRILQRTLRAIYVGKIAEPGGVLRRRAYCIGIQ